MNGAGLIFKWLPSENTSSQKTRNYAHKIRQYLNFTHKRYRKMLSIGREKTKVLERLMSNNEWSKIDFSKIPSRAGLIYRNAFARRDILRERYEKFIMDQNTKVNAKVLYPYECVESALDCRGRDRLERAAINKYWDNLKDYFNGAAFNGMALVDVSGSMTIRYNSIAPINIAIALGLYCAEKCSGPYKGHFITFESNPHFIEIEGEDFIEKVNNMCRAPWGGSTNIEKAFDLMLQVAIRNNLSQEDIPKNLIIISDMQIDACVKDFDNNHITSMSTIRKKWKECGYEMPKLVYWNVNARQNTILDDAKSNITYVSGSSPVIYEMIMQGKNGIQMMYEKLNSERYSCIY